MDVLLLSPFAFSDHHVAYGIYLILIVGLLAIIVIYSIHAVFGVIGGLNNPKTRRWVDILLAGIIAALAIGYLIPYTK
jgi:threonine/homoserine/homoserine lactone efflux protein